MPPTHPEPAPEARQWERQSCRLNSLLGKSLLMVWSQCWRQLPSSSERWKSGQLQGPSRSYTGTSSKKGNTNKNPAILSKRQHQDREIKQQIACCVLVSYLREILGDNARPLQVPQQASACWQCCSSLPYRAQTELFNCVYWPGIGHLSRNCNIWHIVLCIQRVKLCPIKIKISTFIIL